MKDSIGIRLRWSVTPRCSLRCLYCRAADPCASADGAEEMAAEEIAMWIGIFHEIIGVQSLRFTGGEPLRRCDLETLIRAAARHGISDIALTTNGEDLAERAVPLRAAGLRRVNVSLDSLNPKTYSLITRGGRLRLVLAGIDAARTAGLEPVRINMVVLRGINDHDVESLLEFGLERGLEVRFLELMPIGVMASEFKRFFIASSEIRQRLSARGQWAPLGTAHGGTSRNWRVRDAQGRETTIGFISPLSEPFCDSCRRLRLTADGRLIGCLLRGATLDLRPAMRAAIGGDPEPLRAVLGRAFRVKRHGDFAPCFRSMSAVGG